MTESPRIHINTSARLRTGTARITSVENRPPRPKIWSPRELCKHLEKVDHHLGWPPIRLCRGDEVFPSSADRPKGVKTNYTAKDSLNTSGNMPITSVCTQLGHTEVIKLQRASHRPHSLLVHWNRAEQLGQGSRASKERTFDALKPSCPITRLDRSVGINQKMTLGQPITSAQSPRCSSQVNHFGSSLSSKPRL